MSERNWTSRISDAARMAGSSADRSWSPPFLCRDAGLTVEKKLLAPGFVPLRCRYVPVNMTCAEQQVLAHRACHTGEYRVAKHSLTLWAHKTDVQH